LHIDDQAFVFLQKAEVVMNEGEKAVNLSLTKLKMAKIGMCNLTDYGLVTLCKVAPNIEHLEINRLDGLTEYSLNFVFKEMKSLRFIDIQGVSACTY